MRKNTNFESLSLEEQMIARDKVLKQIYELQDVIELTIVKHKMYVVALHQLDSLINTTRH